ncbi:Ivy family c-type lysozyme inhibitor [Brevundimonas vesicularis]|uniref:Ivy family c-type lysozyme inhibitor n=1 Tax=Brevundimonas vesicularis TaxID=41276 RepID=UPI0038D3D4A4
MRCRAMMMAMGMLAMGACEEGGRAEAEAQPGRIEVPATSGRDATVPPGPTATDVAAVVPVDDAGLAPSATQARGEPGTVSWQARLGSELPPYTYDIPDLLPQVHRRWQQTIEGAGVNGPSWVASLKGTAAPLRRVTLGGQPMVTGWICQPRSCGGNELILLFSEDQARIFGLLRLTNDRGEASEQAIGTDSADEIRCARFFMDDRTDAAACGG